MLSISPIPGSAASGRARFRPGKALQMTGPDGNPLVLFDNVFPATPSGKIELKSETLGRALGRGGIAAGLARARSLLSL